MTSAMVLLYGRDHRLLETRQWILQGAGWTVVAISSIDEAKQTMEAPLPKVLVLCHTLTVEDCQAALDIAKPLPHLAVLLLEGLAPMGISDRCDAVLARYLGPADLIAAVTKLAALAESRSAGCPA